MILSFQEIDAAMRAGQIAIEPRPDDAAWTSAGFGVDPHQPEQRGTVIQLEIFNLAEWSVILDVGMRICQLILEEVREVPIKSYAGQFQAQKPFLAVAEDRSS
jgi:deoxycytidine triphosphate deaminase